MIIRKETYNRWIKLWVVIVAMTFIEFGQGLYQPSLKLLEITVTVNHPENVGDVRVSDGNQDFTLNWTSGSIAGLQRGAEIKIQALDMQGQVLEEIVRRVR